ncbi:LURP-one-related/scramblase family protein [Thalassotalea crassostreae]|uniref:LURP-one-related/scramblase family protein n=1 Tax=Thalassotalea crassostreae TaxID=1763536 RepID=UPI000837DF38|nr:LURP-one-related family protein [Thalassotalea crassostreae]
MQRYKLKQRFLSLTEKFEIKNDHDEIVYQVDGKFFSIGKTFHLFDHVGEQLATIKQKLFTLRPTFHITFTNGTKAKVVKTFLPLFSSRFILTSSGRKITVSGNFLSHEFEFNEGNAVTATVSKQWFSLTDTYGLEVADADFSELALCTLIVIDAIHHGSGDNQ